MQNTTFTQYLCFYYKDPFHKENKSHIKTTTKIPK
jgi:hypothetical protein